MEGPLALVIHNYHSIVAKNLSSHGFWSLGVLQLIPYECQDMNVVTRFQPTSRASMNSITEPMTMKNTLNNLCFYSASATTGRNIWIHSNLTLWVASCSKTKVHCNDKSHCRKLKENKNITFFPDVVFLHSEPPTKTLRNQLCTGVSLGQSEDAMHSSTCTRWNAQRRMELSPSTVRQHRVY